VFQMCARCHTMYYCSPSCHQKAWEAGHRQACRYRHRVRRGDIMQLKGMKDIVLVRILGPWHNKEDYWQVHRLEDENEEVWEIYLYAPCQLRHIRPA
jgi:MYND finger